MSTLQRPEICKRLRKRLRNLPPARGTWQGGIADDTAMIFMSDDGAAERPELLAQAERLMAAAVTPR